MKLISIPTQRDCLRLKWKPFHTAAAPRMFGFQFLFKNCTSTTLFVNTSFHCTLAWASASNRTDSDTDSDSDSDSYTESKKSCLVSLALHHPPAKHLKLLNKSRQNGFVVLTLASVMSWFGFENSTLHSVQAYGLKSRSHQYCSTMYTGDGTLQMTLLSIHVGFRLSQRSRLLQTFHPAHHKIIKECINKMDICMCSSVTFWK